MKQLEVRASGERGASLARQCPLSTDTSSITAPPAADLQRLGEGHIVSYPSPPLTWPGREG